jgi:TIR domain
MCYVGRLEAIGNFRCVPRHLKTPGELAVTELLRLKSGHDLRSRLFISHASEDHEIAKTIWRELSSRQISVWIDSERLTPGTPDWEQAIRAGIAQSVAVVVLASPHSQASRYVRAELAIAQSQKIAIVPVWVSGDHWPDCIAMDLIYSQYIDIRGERQDVGIGRLIEELILISRKSLPDHILLDEADIAITKARDNHGIYI